MFIIIIVRFIVHVYRAVVGLVSLALHKVRLSKLWLTLHNPVSYIGKEFLVNYPEKDKLIN